MKNPQLSAISPLDGRYAGKVGGLRELFSEQGLIYHRVLVEVRWVQFLAAHPGIEGIGPFAPPVNDFLDKLLANFDRDAAQKVKDIESTTNHDVKAVEYFLSQSFGEDADLGKIRPFLHFACTSEDINNISYALMLRRGRDEVILPALRKVNAKLGELTRATADVAMMKVRMIVVTRRAFMLSNSIKPGARSSKGAATRWLPPLHESSRRDRVRESR